jgi:hypothetical protein
MAGVHPTDGADACEPGVGVRFLDSDCWHYHTHNEAKVLLSESQITGNSISMRINKETCTTRLKISYFAWRNACLVLRASHQIIICQFFGFDVRTSVLCEFVCQNLS